MGGRYRYHRTTTPCVVLPRDRVRSPNGSLHRGPDPASFGLTAKPAPWSWTDSSACWSWPGSEDAPVEIEVYSDADEVELLINGVSVGVLPCGPAHRYRAVFSTTYRPGTVEAVALRGTRRWDRHRCGRQVRLDGSSSAPTERVCTREALTSPISMSTSWMRTARLPATPGISWRSRSRRGSDAGIRVGGALHRRVVCRRASTRVPRPCPRRRAADAHRADRRDRAGPTPWRRDRFSGGARRTIQMMRAGSAGCRSQPKPRAVIGLPRPPVPGRTR